MEQKTATRTDLVIAMTLAELFLLMLFMVWYGSIETLPGGEPDWKSVASQQEKEIKQLHEELAQQKNRITDLEKRLAFWRDHFGVDAPQSGDELVQILRAPKGKEIMEAAGRGFPQCETSNTLVSVSLANGAIRLEVTGDSPRLRQWSEGRRGLSAKAAVLMDWPAVREYLGMIREFYGAQAKACRFDYQLTYTTNDDYHDGRVEFESVFYPGRITKAP